MIRLRAAGCWSGLLLWAAVQTSVAGQKEQTQPISIRISSEFVLVDLIATDSEGRFVTDLQLDELELLENGKTQPLQYFRLLSPEKQPEKLPKANWETAYLLPSKPEFASPSDGSLLTLVVDKGSVGYDLLPRVKSSIRDFLATAPESTSFLLASVGKKLEIHQNSSPDRAVLLESLGEITSTDRTLGAGWLADFVDEIEKIVVSGALRTRDYVTRDMVEMMALAGRERLVRLEQRLAGSSSAAALLCSYLSTLPGRKQIVLFTAGYPLEANEQIKTAIETYVEPSGFGGGPFRNRAALRQRLNAVLGGGERSSFGLYLDALIAAANQAQASFYAVDARGLVAIPGAGEAGQRSSNRVNRAGGKLLRLNQGTLNQSQQYLRHLAVNTGGLAFLNSNDLTRGARQASQDALRYYLLGYSPQGKRRENRDYTIEVRTTRPGLRLRHRKGYRLSPPGGGRSRLQNAFQYPGLFRDFQWDARVESVDPLRVQLTIPTSILRFRTQEGRLSTTLEMYGMEVDGSGRMLSEEPLFARRFRYWNLTPGQARELTRFPRIPLEIEIPNATFRERLVLVLLQSETGLISTLQPVQGVELGHQRD